jgi:Zn finger protein HypA/HybF involved in hydrogenase expression
VPLELRPGSSVPIPCRQCQKSMIRFSIEDGTHLATCPKCGGATEVKVYTDPSGIRIKTAKASPKGKA